MKLYKVSFSMKNSRMNLASATLIIKANTARADRTGANFEDIAPKIRIVWECREESEQLYYKTGRGGNLYVSGSN